MNPFTAAAIFIPLSVSISIASFNFHAPLESNKTVVLSEKEITMLSDRNIGRDYFIYLSYNTCVINVTDNSTSNNADSDILEVCNPILEKMSVKNNE